MSRKGRPGYRDAKGIIYTDFLGNGILAAGTSVPADASTGYAPGCIWFKTAGTVGAQFYINEGSATSSDFNVIALGTLDLSALTATAAELNKNDDSLATVLMSKGAGVSAMESYGGGAFLNGGMIHTKIAFDVTGLVAAATDLDIIGNTGGAASAHLGQFTVAKNGTTAIYGRMTCLEVPTGSSADVDLYSATVSTGAQDVDVTTLTETALITAGGNWTLNLVKPFALFPTANDYLYLCSGAASGGTFTAGKFLIETFYMP